MRATRAGESLLLLLDVVDLLSHQQIPYAVIGALAASLHGAVRASMDADVLLSAGTPKLGTLVGSLNAAALHTDLRHGGTDDPIPGLIAVSDDFGNRVDLLLGLRGLEREAFSRTVDVAFQGSILKFIGKEDFIAMKAFAGGPIDMVDARRALTASGSALDAGLMRRLAAGYGRDASEALERLLSANESAPRRAD